MKRLRITHWKEKLLLTAAYGVAVFFLWLFQIPCIYRYLLGIPCPGCGMTRAIVSALHLDLRQAFAYHPMFWSIPVLYLYLLVDGDLLPRRWMDRLFLLVIGAGFLLNWVAKFI